VKEWAKKLFQWDEQYKRPYCRSCKLIWGRRSIGRLFNCTGCNQPLKLKSFNPWLKALYGLGVIAGGAVTLFIPDMPVFWIGGLLWGGQLVVNGFRQWSKVRALDHDDGIEAEVVEEVVSCPNCGTGNRIRSHSARMRPVCGKCRQPLPEQRIAGTSLPSFLSFLREHKKGVVGTVVTAALLGILLWANHNTPPPTTPVNPTSTTSLPAPSRVPPLRLIPDTVKPPNQTLAGVEDDDTLPTRSLPTGTMLTTGYLNGHGKLTLDNGTSGDAVVTVINTGNDQAIASFYVKSGQKSTLAGIPDGYFTVIYALGRDWDSPSQAFTRNRSFGRYDKKMSYSTTTQVEGNWINTYYDECSLTLHKVPSGNLTTSRISPDEFKKYLFQTGAIRP